MISCLALLLPFRSIFGSFVPFARGLFQRKKGRTFIFQKNEFWDEGFLLKKQCYPEGCYDGRGKERDVVIVGSFGLS